MKPLEITVNAGEHERENCPVRVPLPDTADVRPDSNLVVRGPGEKTRAVQWLPGDPPELCFILERLPKKQSVVLTVEEIAEPPACPGVVLKESVGDQIEVEVGGKFFTRYRYGEEWARPFLMPVIGPFGDPITRRYPLEQVEGETHDHHHHKSCWVAWGDVNGSDHWSETEGHGRQVHQRFIDLRSGPVLGRIETVNHWVTNKGAKVLEEQRTMVFYNTPASGRLMDLIVDLSATEGPVRFGDTKEGGIASIRVATSMDAKLDGTIVNAYGGTNEAETWGKRAPWCDYTGPVNGNTVGITIFDTPGNFRYPTYWHVRNYGLMTANPFGLSHFLRDKSVDGTHAMAEGERLTFRYRLYFHAGTTTGAGVADRFLDYITPPEVTIA